MRPLRREGPHVLGLPAHGALLNAAVRAAVFARAAGSCEARCGTRIDEQRYGHLDHFFGRAKADETVENCWALCPRCDELKTLNRPDGQTWLRKYLRHAARLFVQCTEREAEDRWLDAIDRALIKLITLRQKGRA